MTLVFYYAAFLILLGTCAFSWWKGGYAERYGSILILAANVAADVLEILTRPHYPYFGTFVLDFMLAFGLLYLALRYNSMWLGFAMLLQSLVIGSYAFESFGDGLQNNAYRHWMNGVTTLMLLSIAAGAVGSWRQRVKASRAADPKAGPRPLTSIPA